MRHLSASALISILLFVSQFEIVLSLLIGRRPTDISPVICQAVGNLSVDSIVSMYHAIPTLRYVKDEAGEPLMRLADLRSKSDDQLKIFTGGHGRTLIDEMIRGFSSTASRRLPSCQRSQAQA